MSRQRTILATTAIVFLVLATVALAQRGRGRRGWDRWGERDGRAGVPMWENEAEFAGDVFTFARVQYGSYGRRRWRGRGDWATDYPDSDLNFSFRLQQLTSFKVNPNPVTVRLTDDALFDYPFIYMVEPGALEFTSEEVVALRRYLLNGGFLMVDDFWGDYEYQNFYEQIKRVFPDREPEELAIDHEIFRCVYRLKEKPQVPSIANAQWGASQGITWETGHGGDCQTVHYKQITDDNDRMMVLICHNTDLGDGWEREGEDEWYFREFAEKKSYPMGINIITYAMTH